MSSPRSSSETKPDNAVPNGESTQIYPALGPRRIPSWRTTMLSPSPSPNRASVCPEASEAYRAAMNAVPARSISVSPPHRPVRAGTASYRSPPPLPRLEIRDDTAQAPDPEAGHPAQHLKQQLPAVYQAQNQSTKDFYPTPISVGEMRWPAQSPHVDHRVGHLPTTSQPSSTDSSPDRSMAQLPTGRSYAPPPTMARPHQPAYVHPGHPQPTYGMMRPRLSIHPYAPPAIPQGENRYWSAGGIPPHLGATHERSYSSPSSALSPNSFKAPRKRADDLQLNVLNEVFDRTSYPSTEEREDLARRLGMTSRSVQIWNRRRAVKVEQQSAIQRAEADALARSRGISAPYLAQSYLAGGAGGIRPSPAPSGVSAPGPHPSASHVSVYTNEQAYGRPHADVASERGVPVIKREVQSPERGERF